MKFYKNIVLSMLGISLVMPSFSVRAVDKDAIHIATAIAIGTGAFLGSYKIYEHCALDHANWRLKENKKTSSSILTAKRTTMNLDDQELVNAYKDCEQVYHVLCSEVSKDQGTLSRIKQETKDDLGSWKRTAKHGWFFENKSGAAKFVRKAEDFSPTSENNVTIITDRYNFFEQRRPLIGLAALVHSEKDQPHYGIIQRVLKVTTKEEDEQPLYPRIRKSDELFTDSDVRVLNPQSSHPILDAWRKINVRQKDYVDKVKLVNAFTNTSSCSQHYANEGSNLAGVYHVTQNTIAGFPTYTDDVRAAKDLELKEETLRQERAKAIAVQKAAEAAERQAQAHEERNRMKQGQELTILRTELSEIKRKINAGDRNHYLIQKRDELQSRINQIRGPVSFVEIFYNVLNDRD